MCVEYQSAGSTPCPVQESITDETSLPSISAPASGNFSSPRNSMLSQPGSMIPESEDNLTPNSNSHYLEIHEQYVNQMGQPIDVKASLMPTPPVLVMNCVDNSTNYHGPESGNPNSEAEYASGTASVPPCENSVPALETNQPDSESISSLKRSDSNIMLERALLSKTHRKPFLWYS